MNSLTAQRAWLVRALETAQPESPLWTAADRAWATRVAREEVTSDHLPDFIARRTETAWRRLGPRLPAAVQGGMGLTVWASPMVCMGLGLGIGLALDALGGRQRIHLLAPPLWGVVAWNLLVYLMLAWAFVRGLRTSVGRQDGAERRPGLLGRLATSLVARRAWQRLPGVGREFCTSWFPHAAPLWRARLAQAFHLGAAALGLGLLAGLYLRGMVWSFSATWESTFLQADQVARLMAWVLGPASALSGAALPSVQAYEAMRTQPVSAAPWIHLFAITLLGVVILPRLLLALWAWGRALRWEQGAALPLHDGYFQALALAAQHGAVNLLVLPHGAQPTPDALARLQQGLAQIWGEGLTAHWGPLCVAGQEDAFQPPPPGATAQTVAYVDMAATPEPQTQGRWLDKLRDAAGASPALLWVDASAFVHRFGHLKERQAQRRQAWQAFAQTRGLSCAFSDSAALRPPDVAIPGKGATP